MNGTECDAFKKSDRKKVLFADEFEERTGRIFKSDVNCHLLIFF